MDDRKTYNPNLNVLDAARQRISYCFDRLEKLYVSFSGGKDSTVMLHLVMAEAIRRGRTVGVLIIDMEAQYRATVEHIQRTATIISRIQCSCLSLTSPAGKQVRARPRRYCPGH